MTLYLGLINLLKWLTKFSGRVTYICSLLKVMIKDTYEQVDKEICSVKSQRILSPGASVSRNLGYVTFPLCSLTW